MVIKNVNQIVTKKGDKGDSKDYSDRQFRKSDILFEVLGTIDELSSNLGLAYHHTKCKEIITVQKQLQDISSLVATNPESDLYSKLRSVDLSAIDGLEKNIQDMLDKKPLEPRFLLPGTEKSMKGAYLDVSRTISRRAERRLTEYIETHQRNDLERALSYINRLSDFLYVLSCNLD